MYILSAQKLQKWWLLDYGICQQNLVSGCPQLLLNDLQDCYETQWIVKLPTEGVHMFKMLVLVLLVFLGEFTC